MDGFSGMYFLSTVATVIMMVTLVTFHSWEKRFAATSRTDRRFIRVTTNNYDDAITDVTSYLSLNGVQIKSLNVKKDKLRGKLVIEMFLKLNKDTSDGLDVISGLQSVEGVVGVENVV